MYVYVYDKMNVLLRVDHVFKTRTSITFSKSRYLFKKSVNFQDNIFYFTLAVFHIFSRNYFPQYMKIMVIILLVGG